MDPTTHPSLQIRPTESEKRRTLLKDLEKPGHIVILHTGEVLTKPQEVQEEVLDGSPNAKG